MDQSANPSSSSCNDMNEPGSTSSPSEVQVLRNLLQITLIALVLISGSFAGFIYIQMKLVRGQLSEQRPGVLKAMRDYNDISRPLIEKFTAKIQAYGATHPDFRPILQKYEPVLGDLLNSSSSMAPVTPAPPAPKK